MNTNVEIFWNHSEQHSFKTKYGIGICIIGFWNHSEQHSSKTYTVTGQGYSVFWNHSEQHSSKTLDVDETNYVVFWNHSEQHSSKTGGVTDANFIQFWNHSEQHSSKTSYFKIFTRFRNRAICPRKTPALNDSFFIFTYLYKQADYITFLCSNLSLFHKTLLLTDK